ncbi:probable ubiquitin-like-specific protease 2A [Chenopodium quinoa]|uniref:probable ubiquitin-like-specific protease 2A n=1 Tax=Chenopodium quinoa TaxID=63459 RepID=UPI000B786547|nr:probable ubiquitin-like-specific protease 2A [Chenopodium quinoa]
MRRRTRKPPSNEFDFTIAGLFGDNISKHRSCWLHIAAAQYKTEKKITLTEFKEIKKKFKHTSPCFLDTFAHAKRSKLMGGRHIIPRIRKKLDTETFEHYMEVVWKSFSEEKRMSFTYLDSLWFSLYREASTRPKVLTWIKKKSIFSKDYVFVPVCCWSHWSLLIFVHFNDSSDSKTRTPCMLLLDSLENAELKRLEPEIRKFVQDIYRVEGREEDRKVISRIPLLIPKVPQQRDDEECGSYVLYFINLFMQFAPENFCDSDYPYFMRKDWFDLENLEYFRNNLEKELSSKVAVKSTHSSSVSQRLCKNDGVILLDD